MSDLSVTLHHVRLARSHLLIVRWIEIWLLRHLIRYRRSHTLLKLLTLKVVVTLLMHAWIKRRTLSKSTRMLRLHC